MNSEQPEIRELIERIERARKLAEKMQQHFEQTLRESERRSAAIMHRLRQTGYVK